MSVFAVDSNSANTNVPPASNRIRATSFERNALRYLSLSHFHFFLFNITRHRLRKITYRFVTGSIRVGVVKYLIQVLVGWLKTFAGEERSRFRRIVSLSSETVDIRAVFLARRVKLVRITPSDTFALKQTAFVHF